MKVVVISVVIVLLVFIFFWRKGQDENIKKNYALEKGLITEVNSTYKGGEPKVKYTYSFKGLSYKSEQILGGLSFRSMYSVLSGRNFDVLVDSTNPGNSHIMVTPDDFEGMKWNYPDSLRWMEKFYQKNFKSTW